jgi:hypothetical protein
VHHAVRTLRVVEEQGIRQPVERARAGQQHDDGRGHADGQQQGPLRRAPRRRRPPPPSPLPGLKPQLGRRRREHRRPRAPALVRHAAAAAPGSVVAAALHHVHACSRASLQIVRFALNNELASQVWAGAAWPPACVYS